MHCLGLPSKYGLSFLMVVTVSCWAAAHAVALTIERPETIPDPTFGVPAHDETAGRANDGVGAGQMLIVRDTSPASLVRAQLFQGSHVAHVRSFHGARDLFVMNDDPLGLWHAAKDGAPISMLSEDAENAQTEQALPIILSAGAVLTSSVVIRGLFTRPRRRARKRKRRPAASASTGHEIAEPETIADVARYILGAVTPPFLKRRKRRRRKRHPDPVRTDPSRR